MDKQSAHNKKLDNALDYCIKLISTGATVEECLRLYPNLRRELRDLLSIVVNTKRAYPEYPELRPSKLYTKTGREKFLAMIEGGIPAIERELFKPKVSRTPTPFSLRELFRKYVGVGVAVAMLVAALGGLLYASGSSLPGSPLYGLKRTIEGVELAMTFDKEGKDRLLHEFSKRRLDEANLLARLGRGKTAVLGYKISKNTTKDNINNLKLDDLTDKNNATDSGKTKPKTANKPRTIKKHKNRKSATTATTTTTTTNPPTVATPFAVNDINTSGDCIRKGSSISITVSGATNYPFDVGLYQGSKKVAVIARQESTGDLRFNWNGKDINNNQVADGEYKIEAVYNLGEVASASANIFVASLDDVNLVSPVVETETVEKSKLSFKWGKIGDNMKSYRLFLVSDAKPNEPIIKELSSSDIESDPSNIIYKPGTDLLTQLIGLNWKWRIIAEDRDGSMAVSNYKSFSLKAD